MLSESLIKDASKQGEVAVHTSSHVMYGQQTKQGLHSPRIKVRVMSTI